MMVRRIGDGSHDDDRHGRDDAGYDVYVRVEQEGEGDGQAPEIHVHVHGPEGHGREYHPDHVEDQRGSVAEGCLGLLWGAAFGWWLGGSGGDDC